MLLPVEKLLIDTAGCFSYILQAFALIQLVAARGCEGGIMDITERRMLLSKRRDLLQKVMNTPDFVRGSVVRVKRRCNKPGCRMCASGRGHPTYVLTYSKGGKTRTAHLGHDLVAAARRMKENYRQVTDWVEEISQINLALLKGGRVPQKHEAE